MLEQRRVAEAQGVKIIQRSNPMTMDDLRSAAIVEYLNEDFDNRQSAAKVLRDLLGTTPPDGIEHVIRAVLRLIEGPSDDA